MKSKFKRIHPSELDEFIEKEADKEASSRSTEITGRSKGETRADQKDNKLYNICNLTNSTNLYCYNHKEWS